MTTPLDRLQELLDRQDILDCVHRYCRAVDRFDREMLLSVYHPPGWERWAWAAFAFGFGCALLLGLYLAWSILRSK